MDVQGEYESQKISDQSQSKTYGQKISSKRRHWFWWGFHTTFQDWNNQVGCWPNKYE